MRERESVCVCVCVCECMCGDVEVGSSMSPHSDLPAGVLSETECGSVAAGQGLSQVSHYRTRLYVTGQDTTV